MNDLIRLANVSKSFGDQIILKDVSLSLPSKGLIVILGESGSGKSTLLNIISGLDEEYKGEYFLKSRNFKKLGNIDKEDIRLKEIGFIYQNLNLLELESVLNNVLLPLDAISSDSIDYKYQKCKDALSNVGMRKKDRRIANTLSGGEKQRVAIARAIVNNPSLLLADEPTGSLDENNSHEIFKILKSISKKKLVLVVTHDKELAYTYADTILILESGKIRASLNSRSLSVESETLFSIPTTKEKKKTSLSFYFIYRHAFHILLAKKRRTLLSFSCISLGLVGIGLSNYLSSSINDEITNAFSSIIMPNQLIMSPSNNSSLAIGNIYSCDLELVKDIEAKYADYVKGFGSSFLYPFETMFPDSNEFYLTSKSKGEMYLPNFNVRLLNDILWLDNYEEKEFFPSIDLETKPGEIVVGMPYVTMASICHFFGIEPSFADLGDLLQREESNLLLFLDNYDWGFEDQELFKIKAITQTKYPMLFSSNHMFAHELFVDHLQFNSSFNEKENPQYIFEVPYIETFSSHSNFLNVIRRDEEFSRLVFDSDISSYLTSVADDRNSENIKRIYVYDCDKNNVGFSVIDKVISGVDGIQGYLPCSTYGYYGSASSIMTGFYNKFFMSNDLEKLEEVDDVYSFIEKNKAFLPLKSIDGVVDGNYMASGGSGLRISTDLRKITSGRKPESNEEICISSSLFNKWNKPSLVYISAEVEGKEIGEYYERMFKQQELKVVGVIDENQDTFYVNSNWTYNFYVDQLSISPFKLEPNGAVFYFDSSSKASSAKKVLEKEFSDYSFLAPYEEIDNSTKSVTTYIGKVLGLFSLIALVISALVFLIVMTITILENQREENIFKIIGIHKVDVVRFYTSFCLIYGGGAFVFASLTLFLAIYGVKIYLANTFSSSISNLIPFKPFLAMLLALGIFLIFVLLGVVLKASKKK